MRTLVSPIIPLIVLCVVMGIGYHHVSLEAFPELLSRLAPRMTGGLLSGLVSRGREQDERLVRDLLCDGSGRIRNVLFSPAGTIREVILSLMRLTQVKISLASYIITDPKIAQGLIDARGRGVDVEVVTCTSGAQERWSKIPDIIRAGVPVYLYSGNKARALMHHKFIIFDGALDRSVVMTGSYNMTRSAATSNAENVLFVDNAGASGSEYNISAQYAQEFEGIKQMSIRAGAPRRARYTCERLINLYREHPKKYLRTGTAAA